MAFSFRCYNTQPLCFGQNILSSSETYKSISSQGIDVTLIVSHEIARDKISAIIDAMDASMRIDWDDGLPRI
jgi:hypothetical protein